MKQIDWPNVLLLAYCGSLLFFAVVFAIIGYLSLNSTLDWHVITYAMAIGRKSMKVAAFIVVAIAMIITIATLVQRIMHTSNVGY